MNLPLGLEPPTLLVDSVEETVSSRLEKRFKDIKPLHTVGRPVSSRNFFEKGNKG